MELPLRIFSDLHLGHPSSRIRSVEQLRPLFRGAATLLFNGDTWEELVAPWKDHSASLLSDLRTIIAEEGCTPIFLSGNHDPSFPGPGYLSLDEEKILITHGDALLPYGAPWKREILKNPDLAQSLWAKYPAAASDIDARITLAREIAQAYQGLHFSSARALPSRIFDAVFPPRRPLAILRAWLTQAQLGRDFCRIYSPKTKFLINGHFHTVGLRHSGEIAVFNTGSLLTPGPAAWVEWDGTLTAGKIIERKSEPFALGPTHWNLNT